MSWPLVTDFSRMLQTPKMAFRDPVLRECTVEKNHLGQPKPRSGNFATVYRGYRPDGSEFAIRVFNRQADLRLERYQAVHNYLKDRSIWSIVNFSYDEKGIRSASDGKLYPLLTMDWVPGVTLFEWARDRSREGYQEALAIGADVWLQLVRQLAAHNIVHGDLQHGNVMVSSEGHFKLVDYDCMAVPEVMGQRNLEIGMVPYQHPGRNEQTRLFPGLDNFSGLVIYVALRALSAAPSLWYTHVDSTSYDKLLFRKEDFAAPASSALYRDLMNSPDNQVRDLTHYLFQLVHYEVHKIPPIDEVLLWCNSLEDLITKRDWDTAVKLVHRMGPGEQIAPHLVPYVEQAKQRVACRQALDRAIQQGNEDEILLSYVPHLLDDYPAAAQAVEQARSALQVRQILQYLEQARQTQNWDAYRQTWQAYQGLLGNRMSAQPYKDEMVRLLRADTLRRLLAEPQVDDRAVVEAWQQLQTAGGHVTAEPLRAEIERRMTRHGSLSKLRELIKNQPKTPTMDFDQSLIAACTPEILKQHSKLQAPYDAARARLQRMEKVLSLANTHECTLDSEQEIATAAKGLPESYHTLLKPRVRQARERLHAFERLQRSLEDPVSDMKVLDVYRELERLTAQNMVPEDNRWRILLASERVPLVKALQLLKDVKKAEELDRRILRVWKESLLISCRDAAPWLPVYQQARQRQQVVEQIEQAASQGDYRTVTRLTNQPCLAGFTLSHDLQQKIVDAKHQAEQARSSRIQSIIAAIQENNRSAFFDLFEIDTVRELCQRYPHHQTAVSRWVEAEILPLDRCGLAADPQGTVEEVDKTHVRLRWTWPAENITDHCRIAVCQQRPGPHAMPDDVPTFYSATIDRHRWQSDSSAHVVELQPDWKDAHVAVWAVLDLGFQIFHTPPLDLGPPRAGKKQRLWGLFG
jgi:serine/threonine protein kinase